MCSVGTLDQVPVEVVCDSSLHSVWDGDHHWPVHCVCNDRDVRTSFRTGCWCLPCHYPPGKCLVGECVVLCCHHPDTFLVFVYPPSLPLIHISDSPLFPLPFLSSHSLLSLLSPLLLTFPPLLLTFPPHLLTFPPLLLSSSPSLLSSSPSLLSLLPSSSPPHLPSSPPLLLTFPPLLSSSPSLLSSSPSLLSFSCSVLVWLSCFWMNSFRRVMVSVLVSLSSSPPTSVRRLSGSHSALPPSTRAEGQSLKVL